MSDERLTLKEALERHRQHMAELDARHDAEAKKRFIHDQSIDFDKFGNEYLAYVDQSWAASHSAMLYQDWYVERLEAENASFAERIATLERQVAELQRRMNEQDAGK